MGVQGLTSFIAKHAERYLRPYELHDCELVIDGDNLACNLYKDVSGCNSAFGGDYDIFYETVVNFFQILQECNIRPYVLMDGGYETKKMRAVERRLRTKIGVVKFINPCDSRPVFPLMMRETFVDAVKDCGIPFMRCLFEADDEIAVLSRKLNCPVLSYDSDFYIHNVKYIPFVTLTCKVLTKTTFVQECRETLRHCEAKKAMKKKKFKRNAKSLDDDAHLEKLPVKVAKKKEKKTYKYLDCCIYTIENLIESSIHNDMLPIFAALIGNDYIQRSCFSKFFSQVSMKHVGKKLPKQQKKIVMILRWLQHETKESAMEKILGRMKKQERSKLLQQILSATDGYNREYCEAYEYFGLANNTNEELVKSSEETIKKFEKRIEKQEEQELLEEEGVSEEGGCEEASSEVKDIDSGTETDDDTEHLYESTESHSDSETEINTEQQNIINNIYDDCDFPEWFRKRVHNGDFPRFFVDLVHLNLYINNPQIENFLYEDYNTISYEILVFIFSLLSQTIMYAVTLRYLTRCVRITNVVYKKFEITPLYPEFDPEVKSLEAFKEIFESLRTCEEIFHSINEIPEELRLYFLAIVFWGNKSIHSDGIHLNSLVICSIIIGIVNQKVKFVRDENSFKKKFGKMLQKSKSFQAGDSDLTSSSEKTRSSQEKKIEELTKKLKTLEKVKYLSKRECINVQNTVRKYFNLDEKFKKKHNDFSSTILHGFSEFQSVLFNLYSLNALVNYPLETIKISQFYNGVFLYNMYVSLRDRQDVNYYVKNYIFQSSPILFEYYHYLMEWCRKFIPHFRNCKTGVRYRDLNRKNKFSMKSRRELDAYILSSLDMISDTSELDAFEIQAETESDDDDDDDDDDDVEEDDDDVVDGDVKNDEEKNEDEVNEEEAEAVRLFSDWRAKKAAMVESIKRFSV